VGREVGETKLPERRTGEYQDVFVNNNNDITPQEIGEVIKNNQDYPQQLLNQLQQFKRSIRKWKKPSIC